jgi:plastocyanin
VSVAVDNHFHDVHVDDDIRIAGDRPFVVKNQGRNLHNVTIPGTDIDVDIRPGKEWSLEPLEETLEPDTYSIVCRYHAEQGMVGQITVTE